MFLETFLFVPIFLVLLTVPSIVGHVSTTMFFPEFTVICMGFLAIMVFFKRNTLALFLIRVPTVSGLTVGFTGNLLRDPFLTILNSFENYKKSPQILRDIPLGKAVLVLPVGGTHLED